MNEMNLLGTILDLGAAMIRCGAETHRAEDSLYRLCTSYGFADCNIWVVPTNIQATVTVPSGQCLTQIRHVPDAGIDFDRLDQLNDLCRKTCAQNPEAEVLRGRLSEIMNRPSRCPYISYAAGALAGCGFSIFFNCDAADTAVAFLASILITFLGQRLRRRERNPLTLNFLIAFLTELFILLAARTGAAHHPDNITVGVVMLLISTMGTINGIRDMVHLDTLSGLVNITVSLTGAIGIALGICAPMFLFRYQTDTGILLLQQSFSLATIGCMTGCLGFALLFHVPDRKIVPCIIGALLTWCIYLFASQFLSDPFVPILPAAVCCGIYAEIMARIRKSPVTIFRTIGVFPLIPGASLYYMMCGIVMREEAAALAKGLDVILTSFGIVLGFMASDVLWKYLIMRPKQAS